MNVQAFNKISIVVAENCAIKQKMAMGIGFLQKKKMNCCCVLLNRFSKRDSTQMQTLSEKFKGVYKKLL